MTDRDQQILNAINELDRCRHTYELAEEEYTQMLNEFGDEFGESAREAYEEQHV